MKKLIVVSVLALASCSNTPPAPSYVEVKVPVAVPCKTADVARPAFAVDQLPIGATIDVRCERCAPSVTRGLVTKES